MYGPWSKSDAAQLIWGRSLVLGRSMKTFGTPEIKIEQTERQIFSNTLTRSRDLNHDTQAFYRIIEKWTQECFCMRTGSQCSDEFMNKTKNATCVTQRVHCALSLCYVHCSLTSRRLTFRLETIFINRKQRQTSTLTPHSLYTYNMFITFQYICQIHAVLNEMLHV